MGQEVAQLMTGKASVYYSTIGWNLDAARWPSGNQPSHDSLLSNSFCSKLPQLFLERTGTTKQTG